MSNFTTVRPTTDSFSKILRKYLIWSIAFGVAVWGGLVAAENTALFDRLFDWLGEETPWYLTRSSGIVAYVLMTGSVVWGLILSTRSIRGQVPPPITLALHNVFSWLSFLLAVIHAAVLRASTFFDYAWVDILIPFRGPYRPFWVGLGVVAAYLMFLVNLSFDWRRWLGTRTWRSLHYTTFLIFLLVSIHVIMSGSDVDKLGMRLVVVGSIGIVFFLTAFRLLLGQQKRRSTHS